MSGINLNLTNLSNLSQIISAVAVVISLLYVGQQIRQNTKATEAAMRQAVADNDITYLMSSLDNSIIANAFYKIEYNLELTDLEKSQLATLQHVNFRVFENAFYQYQQGLLEKETWDRYESIISMLIHQNEASQAMWEIHSHTFTASFQSKIKQIRRSDLN